MDTNSPPETTQKGCLCRGEKRPRRRNAGPRSGEMEGRGGGGGGGLVMDEPWLLIRSDLSFYIGWSGASDCQEPFWFSRRGASDVLLPTAKRCSLISASFRGTSRGQKVAKGKLGMRNLITNNQGRIDCECSFCFFSFHFRSSSRSISTERI